MHVLCRKLKLAYVKKQEGFMGKLCVEQMYLSTFPNVSIFDEK